MRILAVTNMYPSPERPGWGSFVKSQLDSLVKRGVEVDLLVIEGYKTWINYLGSLSRIRRLCSSRTYDLVHAHYGLSGLVARTQFRYPVVVSFCGDDLYGRPDGRGRATFKSRVFVVLHKALSRVVDGVIVKSDAMRKLLPGGKATVLPNGVRLELFRPMDRLDCRRILGLAEDRIYLLFPYDPTEARKNFGLLERVVDILNGEGESPRFEALVVKGAPSERMPLYINAADVLVLPSFWEGSPNAVKEAMACNTRIVASDVGDVKQLIEGVDGCLLCDLTPDDLSNKIRQALATSGKTRGRERMAPLSVEAIADKLISEYEAIINGAKTGTLPAGRRG